MYPKRDTNSHVLSDTGFLDRRVYHSTIWAFEQIPGIEPGSRPYQGRVITDYTITAYIFVPQTGLEPAHSDFKPDTTTNYVTGAFNLFVPLPELESGHYASKAHTTTNYVIEAFNRGKFRKSIGDLNPISLILS